MNRPERWNVFVVVLHGLGALAIISLLALGLYMTHADLDAAREFELYQLHKTLGWLALLLTLARLFVRAATTAPASLPTIAPLAAGAAHFTHFALYALALLTATTGWVRISSAIIPIPIDLFGLANVPDIAPVNAGLSDAMAMLHRYSAWALALLVAIHAAAALKHHFIDRDATLRRMAWPGRIRIVRSVPRS